MKYLSRILFGLAGILLLLGFEVARYNWVFIMLSFLIGAIAYFMSTSIENKESIKANKELTDHRNYLLKKGLKIQVDLSTCSFISNNYRQENIKENYSHMDQYKALDALSGRDTREFSNIIQTVIVCEQEIEGKKIKFYSKTFQKDETTLRLYLSQQKTAWLYVDTHNPKNYYFNIEL